MSPTFTVRPKLYALATALVCLPLALAADPTQINSSNTCLSCHSPSGAAALSFLEVNGATAPNPAAVTITPGSAFTFVYRSTGLYTTPSYPDTGGAVIPPDTVNWVVSQGPVWNDNGHSGSTPWTAPNSLFYRTDYPAADNNLGVAGLTANNGSATAPVDMNGLASNEVMSANVSISASLAPGAYSLTVAAMGNNGSPVSCSAPFSVYVVVPSPTNSVTPQESPTSTVTTAPAGSSPTDTPSLTQSPTVSPTATFSPTFSASPSFSPTPALGSVTGNSFPAVDKAVVAPNPVSGGGGALHFHALAAAQDMRLRLYDRGFVLILQKDLGPVPGGWNSTPLPIATLKDGLYFLTVGPVQGPYDRPSRPALMYVLK